MVSVAHPRIMQNRSTLQVFPPFPRILEMRGERASIVRADADADWHEHVVLEIGPHPDLSDTQKK